jgi:hypothetical protein
MAQAVLVAFAFCASLLQDKDAQAPIPRRYHYPPYSLTPYSHIPLFPYSLTPYSHILKQHNEIN